jgi:hypothetical protein
MAMTKRKTSVVGNPVARAFGAAKPKKYVKRAPGAHRHRNPGDIIGFTMAAGNPGRKQGGKVAQTKKKYKKSSHRNTGVSKAKRSYKKNPGSPRRSHHHTKKYRRNPVSAGGGFGGSGVGGLVTNAVFVIVGALGSKLGTQAVLGTNNVGVIGYAGNAAIGGVLWFITEKLMKNRAASAGIISGVLVQILLRVINDYTPFGSYVAQLGMGDYQAQSFVTPQVLVDPWNSARIQIPPGWSPRMVAAAPAGGITPAGAPMPAMSSGGGKGVGSLYGGGRTRSALGGGLYAV